MAVTTTVATLALDVGDKVSRELRTFGANIMVTPAADGLPVSIGGVDYRPAGSGAFLDESRLVNLKKIFWRNNIMAFAPFLDAPATLGSRRVEVIGTWFSHPLEIAPSNTFLTGLRELHPEWQVRGAWPRNSSRAECLVGARLASAAGISEGEDLALGGSGSASLHLRVSGILETGGAEDDAILAPLAAVQQFTGLEGKIRSVAVSALTKPEDAFARVDVSKLDPNDFDRWLCTPYASSIAYQIEQAIPGSEAQPVFPVAETEGKIMKSVGLLMTLMAVAALIAAGLAVASIMLATVLERRVEIGLYKSLGATDGRVATIFLLEALAVGLAGGVAGFALGGVLAERLSRIAFGSPATWHWVMFPLIVALALILTLAASAFPLGRGLKLSPAAVLRNE